MKHWVLAILFCPFLTNCTQSTEITENVKVDQKQGYKDLPLDGTLGTLQKKAELVRTLDNQCTATKIFEIQGGNYTSIGAIAFNKVELEFVMDSLYRTVLSKSYTLEDMDNLREAYTAQFGRPSKEEISDFAGSEKRSIRWDGKKYYIDLTDKGGIDLTVEYGSYRGLSRSVDEYINCEERKKKKVQSDL